PPPIICFFGGATGGGARSIGDISGTNSLTLSRTGFIEKTVSASTTIVAWKPTDIMKDFRWVPYSPQISFTATGCEVTSRGGSLGGLIASLTFLTKDLYQGSSICSASRRARWSSASLYKG